MQPTYSQIDIANFLNVSSSQILKWEEHGLISPKYSRKTKGRSARKYDDEDFEQIQLVAHLVKAGFSSKRIKEIRGSVKFTVEPLPKIGWQAGGYRVTVERVDDREKEPDVEKTKKI